jgi:hypothetical protein
MHRQRRWFADDQNRLVEMKHLNTAIDLRLYRIRNYVQQLIPCMGYRLQAHWKTSAEEAPGRRGVLPIVSGHVIMLTRQKFPNRTTGIPCWYV